MALDPGRTVESSSALCFHLDIVTAKGQKLTLGNSVFMVYWRAEFALVKPDVSVLEELRACP